MPRKRVRRNEREHGRGSIKQLPDGRFRAWKPPRPHPADPDRTVRASRTVATRELAEAWLAGGSLGPGMALGEWLERWYAARLPTLSWSTARNYAADLALLAPLGRRPLADVTSADVQAVVNVLLRRYARSSVHRARGVWSSALGAAVRAGLLAANPVADTRLPRAVEAPPKAWTAAETARLLDAARGGPHEAWLHLALATGARMGELRALEWPDVDLRALTVTIGKSRHNTTDAVGPTKTGRVRVVDLPPETVAVLVAHQLRQRPGARLVVGPYSANAFRGRLRTLCKAAGVPKLTPHSTRHTFCSLLIEAGVPIPDISRALGHASIKTTMAVYAHFIGHGQRRTAGAIAGALYGAPGAGITHLHGDLHIDAASTR